MVTRIPLERIFDNPFQTRGVYADIEELAESIRALKNVRPETSGLMQVGTARIIIAQGVLGWKVLNPDEYGGVQSTLDDEPDSFVQIAFSHRRLRAFHFLSQADPDYGTYPLEVLPLTDRQMSDLAWEENAKRSDLSPIERAEALQQAIETFGYTQEALGERWGLAKTTVSNALRLLKLPQEAQEAIRKGELTAKHGLALLTAQAKSPTIFQKAMEAIIPPPPVAEEAEEVARRLLAQHHFWEVNNLSPETSCKACSAILAGHGYSSGDKDYLCSPCYRAASYTAPSVAEAERTVRSITNRYAVSLERADFPLDIEITPIPDEGGGVTWLRSATCNGCSYREGETCFDRACHDLKGQSWKEAQASDLKARLVRDYGVDPKQVKINYGYNGHDLEKRTVDPDLIKVGGPCAPGQCQRLQFHYQTYDSSSKIRVYSDLPFIFQCNNSTSHAAAQRRYQEGQKSKEEKTEAVQAAEAAATRKAEAKAILDQALTSFAIALRDGHDGAWTALYETFRYVLSSDHKHEPEAGAPGYMLLFTGQVLRDSREALTSKWHDWGREDAVERFQKGISEKLNKYGITQAVSETPSARPQATLVDIIAKLEKVQGFAMSARIAGNLTIEQVEGNRANVQKLVDQLHELHRAGLLQNDEDFGQITHLVREALDELWEGGREIDEAKFPQDWGQETEAEFNRIVWAIMQLPGGAPEATRRTALSRVRADACTRAAGVSENAQKNVSPENTEEPEPAVAP